VKLPLPPPPPTPPPDPPAPPPLMCRAPADVISTNLSKLALEVMELELDICASANDELLRSLLEDTFVSELEIWIAVVE